LPSRTLAICENAEAAAALLLLLLLLLLEDAKSSWDSESREASFTGASGFVCRPQANYARRISARMCGR